MQPTKAEVNALAQVIHEEEIAILGRHRLPSWESLSERVKDTDRQLAKAAFAYFEAHYRLEPKEA